MAKLKLALYWAASCGGCEIGQLMIGDKILKLIEAADIVFWPVAIDVKYDDVEAMPAQSIDVCLFNGAIRNSEQEHMAKTLREKSKILIAYGACACRGGIPGLGNLHDRRSIFNTVYRDTVSTEKNGNVFPLSQFMVGGRSDNRFSTILSVRLTRWLTLSIIFPSASLRKNYLAGIRRLDAGQTAKGHRYLAQCQSGLR
jgi:hypothetical protein